MKKIDDALLYKLIGKRIRARRFSENTKKLIITQGELAKHVGVTRTSITNIEKGNQNLPVHLVYEICAHLDLKIQDILPSLEKLMDSIKIISPSLDKQFGEDKERVKYQVKNFLDKRIKKV